MNSLNPKPKRFSGVLLLFLLTLFSLSVSAQVTLYSENFNSYANGTTSSSTFTSVCSGSCRRGEVDRLFEVNNSAWEIRNNDEDGIWTSSSINISSHTNVSITISAWATDANNKMVPGNESEYQLRFYYKINGGAETFFSNNGNLQLNFGSVTASHSGLNGNTLQIVVRARSKHQDAAYFFDNIVVLGNSGSSSVTPITCNGGNDGRITSTLTAGLLPWFYSWSNGANGNTINGLSAGTYTVTVTGLLGASASESFTLIDPPVLNYPHTKTDLVCFGANIGAIDLTVSGGKPPYSYNWSNGATTQDLSSLAAGTFTVTITDNGGCVRTSSITITSPAVLNTPAVGTNVSCFGLNDGSINQTISGGTSPYAINWSNGATTEDIGSLSPGFYSVTITDSNSCTSKSTTLITQPASPLSTSNSQVNVSCNSGSNGSINLSVSGGTTPYSYLWSNSATTQNISGLIAGSYTVTVTDANNCTTTRSATVTEPAAASLSYINVNILCNGASTGSVDLTVSGGTDPYTYIWSAGFTTEDISGRPAGTYNVTVTDNNGCSISGGTTLTQPTAIVASNTRTNITCNGANDGTINLTVSGGVPPYIFSWSNGATTEDVSGLAPGAYAVTVKDDNGCTKISSAIITQPSALATSNTKANVSCFGGSNGSINLSVSGGTAPFSYNWSNGATTQNISGLVIGTYSVTVTDVNSCTATQSDVITQPTAVGLSFSVVNVSCFGYNTGSIDLTVSGGTASYTYSWSTGHVSQDLNNRLAGTYTVTVTDANGCTMSGSATITQPATVSLTTTQVNVSCNGGNNGSLDLTVTGGVNPLTYSWSNGATTQDVSGLSSGTYRVTVTDANSCTTTKNTTITQPAVLSLSSSQIDVSCFGGSNGSVNLSLAGGTSPYNYIWSNGATTEDISGLVSGSYTVTTTDANSCTATRNVTITQPVAALSTSYTQINASCFGASNGSVNLSVSGGTSPYSYIWSSGATTQDISSRPAGTYTVTVTDARGCTTTNSATLTQPTQIVPTTTQVNVTCFGGNNGSIDLSVSGGVGPYSFSWSTGANTEDISGRTAGTYTVTVTDATGCTATKNTTITQSTAVNPTSTQVNVSCFGGSNGSIDLSVSGGNSPYTYLWSTGATTQDISGLAIGSYTVTVTDAFSCTGTRNVTITQPAAVLSTSESHVNVSCFGGSNGSINLSVAGGTSPYTYIWSTGATTQDIGSRPSGTYTVTVTDANACTTTRSVILTQPATAVSTSETHVNVSCFGGNNGSIDLSVNGGVSPYTYSWSTGATTQDIVNRTAGTYTVTVTDANSCTTTRNITITQPSNILVPITPTSPVWYGGTDGSADLTPSGGTPAYTYLWSTGATTQDLSNVGAGNYSVTLTDANSCTKVGSVVIANSTQAEPYCEAFEPFVYPDGTTTSSEWTRNVSGCNLGDGGYFEVRSGQFAGNDLDGQGIWTSSLIDITGMTGVQVSASLAESGTLESDDYIRIYYKLNGGAETLFPSGDKTDDFTSATVTITGLSGSTLQIVIRVDNDDVAETHTFDDICVTGTMMFAVTAVVTNDTCIGGRVGAIDVTVDNASGTPPFTYTWSNGATTQDITGLSAGSYSITVRDVLNRTVSRTVAVSEDNKFCAGALTCRTVYYIIQAANTSSPPDVYYIDNEDATFTLNPINTTQTAVYNGIGYNHKDGFMYGVEHSGANSGTIWKIDSAGNSTNIGRPAGIAGDQFYSATVFEDGTLATFSGTNKRLYRVNIASTPPVIKNFTTLSGMDFIDIAVNPRDGKVYGYDRTAERFFWMDTTLAAVNFFGTTYTSTSYSLGSAFFDPLGNMYVYGTNASGGNQQYMYRVNVGLNGSGTGNMTQIGTGPAVTFSDGCSCPFGFFLHKLVSPASAMAGDTVQYSYVVGNMSLFNVSLDLVDQMDDGRKYLSGSLINPLGGAANGYGGSNYLFVDNFTIASKTIDTIKVKVVLPMSPLPAIIYNQAHLVGVPAGYADTIVSDYPVTPALPDETPLLINNRPPTVVNDTVTTCRNTAIAINVLANDIDYDGSLIPSSVTVVSGPANGTVTGAGSSSSLYCQQFTFSNGTTTNASWTRDVTATNLGDGGHFEVQSNRWSGNDLDGEAIWRSSVVNISAYTTANLAVDLSSSGDFESDDYINVYYKLNGGPEIALNNGLISNDFSPITATGNVSGTTVQIVIRVRNSSTSEYHYFDNVCITGITGGTGVLTYTPNSGFTGVNTFTYNVCDNGSPASCRTATVRVTVSSALTITLVSLTNSSCSGGAIDISVSGGTSPYNYLWSNGATTQDLTALPSATYGVTVTDATGCSTTGSYNITLASVLATSIVKTDVSCNGGNNGAIDLTVTGGKAPLIYIWSNGATTQDLTGRTAGTYNVTVTDANACTITTGATITQPTALSASNTFVNVSCNGGNNGSINLTASGGTTPYTYNWGGGVTTEDRTTLNAGSYTVTVTDANGCTTTSSRTIAQPTSLSASTAKVDVSCNGGNNGSINLTASGGTSPYTYLWTGGVTTEDRSALAIGIYNVTVNDANGCTTTTGTTLTQPTVLAASATQVNVNCNGGNTGSIDLTVIGGVTTYSYIWSNGATTQDINSLTSGNYTVTITDANSCTLTFSATILQPSTLSASAATVDVTCFGSNNGSIDLTALGGTSPYTFLWTGGATTEDRTNLTAGTYNVTVTDANSCTATTSAVISQSSLIVASSTKVDASCNGASNGSIDLSVSGGLSPYTFVWSNAATTEDISSLSAGTRTVTITDAQSCTITASAIIGQPAALAASTTKTNVSCNGGNNGSINLTVSGGTTPYSFSWSNGATTEDISGLYQGTFNVTITDAQNCTATTSAVINEPLFLSGTTSKVNASCNGGNNGSINLTPAGGTSPYTFGWSNGATTEDVNSLAAGIYSVTLTDANSCTFTTSTAIFQPTVLSASTSKVDQTCNGGTAGSINLSVSGGTSPYTFIWNTAATTQGLINLSAGTYNVTITDANSCTITHSETITEPAVMAASSSQVNVVCSGASTGSIDLTITGGLPPFYYMWSNGAITEDITNLAAGSYDVTVSNSFGTCFVYYGTTITQPATLSSTISKTDVSCFGYVNGAVNLSPSGGTSPYTYSWAHGATTQNLSGVGAGTFNVTITDASGCTISRSTTVNQPAVLAVSTTKTDASCFGGSNGSITLSVTGGTSAYSFNWSNGATTQNLSWLSAGTYNVTVTDVRGCTVSSGATIGQPSALSASTTQVNVNCNGNNNGSINLTVSGGTSPYTYGWSNGASTEDLSGLPPATYNVVITDANGCTTTTGTTIIQPALLTRSTSKTDVSCFGGSNGVVDLTVAGGTTPYSYNWSNGATTQDVSTLTSGVYGVTITDANGCSTSTSTTINQPAILTTSIFSANVSCNGGSDGSVITLSVTGGTTPYNYLWSTGETTQTISGLLANTYRVTVTDANGCVKIDSTFISEPSSLVTSTSRVNVSCNGESTGSINLTVSGGTPPYSYNWSNGETDQDIDSLSIGTYNVTITDANSCTAADGATITEPAALTSSVTDVEVSCSGGNNGSIDLTVSGGTTPYSYGWSNGATTQDVTGLAIGTYDVTVTDALGCTVTDNANISEPTLLVASTTKIDVNCNGGNDGSIDLMVSGGVTPYSYTWSNTATTQDVNSLTAGAYSVTVTDANGCTATTGATLTQPTTLALSTSKVDVVCNAGNNGSIDFTVSGGTAPYDFNWSNGETTEDIATLTATIYNVTVTDAQGCTATIGETISEPSDISITSSTTDASCNGGVDGAIDVSVSGGTAPYTYVWVTSAITEDISSIASGSYSLTVTDANSCTKTANIAVGEASALTITLDNFTPLTCNGSSNGALDISISGGTLPYIYAWSTGATTEDVSNLIFGSYTVTVTDANSCNKISIYTFNTPLPLVGTSTKVNASCNGGSNGSIDLSVTGGTAPYTYLWSNAATTQDVSGLSSGTYNVTITDNNGCTATTGRTITQPTALAASNTKVDVTCNGAANGSIDLTVSGGTSPYTYNWSNTANIQDINGLVPGSYSVVISDAQGCIALSNATITQPAVLAGSTTQINVSCNGAANASINLTVSGGTSPYTFIWSNAATTEDISGLSIGNYSVTITDSKGCIATTGTTITQPVVLTATKSQVNVSCKNGNDGSINITVAGGTTPYTYIWTSGATTEDRSALIAGTYNITVTDARGCTATQTATITEPAILTTAISHSNVSCNGGSNGSVITLIVTGGTSPYGYLWSTGATTQVISGLTAAKYYVTVTDAKACVKIDSVSVTEPTLLTSSIAQVNVGCNGGNDGSIDVSVNGGTPPYSYNWSNGPTTQDISNLSIGTYNVTITDANGCTNFKSIGIIEPATLTISNTKTDVKCYGDSSGIVDITVTGGTAPFTYLWSNGATSEDATGLTIGSYSVTVTDAKSCTENSSAVITQTPGIITSMTKTDASCKSGNDGQINLSVSGGIPPYIFLWSNGATTEDVNSLTAGTYSVTVTDSLGCQKTPSIAVGEPALLVATLVKINVSCFGGSDGVIDVSVVGGTPPYIYAWSTGATTQDLSGLPIGSYNVVATDAKGCIAVVGTTLTQPANIVLLATKSDVNCNGNSNGSVNLTVSGGVLPYTFAWSNGATTEDISGLLAGTYTVTVTDSHNCTKTLSRIITQPTALSTSLSAVNVNCSGCTDGSIDLTVSGGTPAYTYLWSNGATTQDISGLAAATYCVTVTDNQGCINIKCIDVDEPDSINISVISVNVSCNGGNNGSINISVTGGVPPYTYLWSNGETTEDLTNILAGNYSVTVVNFNGIKDSAYITITEPTLLASSSTQVNVSCNGGNNGSINLTVSGGTTPYSYNWSNGETTQDISALAIGTFTVTITDAQGCSTTQNQTITEPANLVLSLTSSDASCNGGTDGGIDLTISGGTTPYAITWSNGNTNEDLTALASGTYGVTVVDANGCTKNALTSVSEATALTISLVTTTNVGCNAGNDGAVNISVSGGTTPYLFAWSNGATTEDVSGLTAAGYSVTVTDANSCSKVSNYTITQPIVLAASASLTHVNCNAANTGAVDVTVSGGTLPYVYVWSSGQTTQDISSLAAGTYNVTISDAKGCTVTLSNSITQPAALSLNFTQTNVLCNGSNEGSIDATVSGGVTPYSYYWSNDSITEDLNNLFTGNYLLTVTDLNGCTATGSVTINQPSALSLTGSSATAMCGEATGSATVNVSGGVPAYSYYWIFNGETTNTIDSLWGGNYEVIVTDQQGCDDTIGVFVNTFSAAVVTVSTTDVSCNNGNDGTATAFIISGTPPFVLNWLPSGGSDTMITGLSVGTYTISLIDSAGCVTSAAGIVAQPTTFSTAVAVTDVNCNGGNDGSINITIGGSTPPYTFLWSNGATTEDVSGLTIGSYSVTITDAQSCTVSTGATISQPTTVVATPTKTDASCNGGNDGSITLAVSGGVEPYTVSWSDGETTQDISGLPIGTYSVTVTDAQGCSVVNGATVNEPALLAASILKTDVSCNNGSDGTITLTVSGGTFPYSFSWSNGETTKDIFNLSIGTYDVTVSDVNGCSATASTGITQPAVLAASFTTIDVSCNGGADGSINLTVSGGTVPYTFSWSNGDTTEDISGLAVSNYFVTITDSKGCIRTAAISIDEPTPLTASITKTNVSCTGGTNGSINLTAGGGTPSYSYLWNTGATTQNLTNLSIGTYTVTVTDAKLCTRTATTSITQPAALSVNIAITPVTCNGGKNGKADVTVSGGTPTYTYLWSMGATVEDLNNIFAGSYALTVTDNNGCTATGTANVTQPAAIAISLTAIVPVSCNGGNNGSLDISVAGGIAPYSFIWSNGATTEDISGLVSGTYTVSVTDANNCLKTSNFSITQPAAIAVNISGSVPPTCAGNNNGSVSITVSGGTLPYTYLWSNGATVKDISGLIAALYQITVTDANGCSASANTTLTNPATMTLSLNATGPDCFNGNNGAISLTVNGGTLPYTYNWSNGATTQNINGLLVGSYSVIVNDGNNCTASASGFLNQPVALSVNLLKTDVKCRNGNDGAVNATISGGTAPYTYHWSNGTTTEDISGLIAGVYSITVTDFKGCTATAGTSVSQPAIIALTLTKTNINCNGAAEGTINLTVSGGIPPYSFNWSNGATTEDLNSLIPGIYSITVTDANGCTRSSATNITQPAALAISIVKSDVKCNGASDGSIDITVSGGTAPYFYEWNGGQTSQDLFNKPAGTYSVTVTDINGCTKVASTILIQPLNLSASVVKTDVSCQGGNDGAIDLTISGGTPPYTYLWSSSATTQDIVGVTANNYTVTITDAHNCVVVTGASLTSKPALAIAVLSISDATCNAVNNASISISVTGGTTPYTYVWSNGLSTKDISNLIAGSYSVTVTDAAGCTKSQNFNVGQPTVLVVSVVNINQALCDGNTSGAINISVSGGTTPYTFIWSNGSTTEDIDTLTGGSYNVTVTDAQGCTKQGTYSILQPNALTISTASISDDLCNVGNKGHIDINVSGGTTPYTYVWSNSATTQDLVNIGKGSYGVTVTDANNCIKIGSYNIGEPTAIVMSVAAIADSKCFGSSGGSIDINVSGGTPGYTYIWNNGATTQDVNSLGTGSFSVTVTDTNGCKKTGNYNIGEPTEIVIALVTGTDALCFGSSSGAIDIQVSGGTPPYTYSWNTSATTQDITALTAGNYSVTVRDANRCSKVKSFTITEPNDLTINVTGIADAKCNGSNDGFINVQVNGGTPPYAYHWDKGATTQNISLLSSDNYKLTVTDANGCYKAGNYNIGEPADIALNVISISDASCYGDSSGFVNINVAGGTPDYTFVWSNGLTTQNATAIPVGSHSVTITDAQGCAKSGHYNVGQPSDLILSLVAASDVPCQGQSNGAVNIQISGGTPGYTYVWNNAATTQDLNGIIAGSYNVTITDSLGCTRTGNYTISEPATLAVNVLGVVNAKCNGGNDGSVDVNVSGGTPPYAYVWTKSDSLVSNNQNLNSLKPGVYEMTVTDAKGCTGNTAVSIGQATSLTIVVDLTQQANCYGSEDGALNIHASGGTPAYSYVWNTQDTSKDLSGLKAGAYTVTATDKNGCSGVKDIEVGQPEVLDLNASKLLTASCNEALDGNIEIIVHGGTSPFSYLWSSGATTSTLSNLGNGTYQVTITDARGCKVEKSFQIEAGPCNLPPVAVNDTVSVSKDGRLNIPVMINDYDPDEDSIHVSGIAVNPVNGTVIINADGTITYIPDPGFTGVDSFSYTICDDGNPELCDNAWVIITIQEDDSSLFIPSGFSPNRDESNEYFEIKGIDKYPNNEIKIFNRWGNEIFSTRGYHNEWRGDNLKGEPLPDGTYFYVLHLNDEAKTTYTGYVVIFR